VLSVLVGDVVAAVWQPVGVGLLSAVLTGHDALPGLDSAYELTLPCSLGIP
jgi:hypothetical protein